MRALAEYVMRDRKQAVFAALLFAFLPLCGWLSLSIIGLVTLRKGPRQGLFVLAWAALPAMVIAALGKPVPLINDVLFGSVIVWGMALMLRSSNSWSTVLQRVTLYLGGIIAIALVVYPDLPDGWEQFFNQLFTKFNVAAWDVGVSETALKLMVHDFAQLATGIHGAMVLSGSLVSLLFARWMQALLYNPGGLKEEFQQIRLSAMASLVLLVVAVGIMNGNLVAINVGFVVAVPFIVASISLFHRLVALTTKQTFWLIGFYTGLVLCFPYSALLLILAAFIDSAMDIRKQIQLKKQA